MATTENRFPWQDALVSSSDAHGWSTQQLLTQPMHALVDQALRCEPALAGVVLKLAISARSVVLKQGLGMGLSQEILEAVLRSGMVATLLMARGCRRRLEEVTGAFEDE